MSKKRRQKSRNQPAYFKPTARQAVRVLGRGQLKAGTVYTIAITHADGCAIADGTPPCTCTPAVGVPRVA